MRLATFNLLHGMPVDGGRPDAAAAPDPSGDAAALLREAVASLDADVLGVQEADAHQPRSGLAHQVHEAAAALGAPWWRFAPSVLGTPGPERSWVPAEPGHSDASGAAPVDVGPRYGVGLVSRLPVARWQELRLAPSPRSLPLVVPPESGGRPQVLRIPDEPRAAVAAVIEGRHGPLTVATVHLSFVPGRNTAQLRAVQRWLAAMPRPLLLVGDLNLPGAVVRRATGWTSLARAATYPSSRPSVQLDHVLADGLPPEAAAAAAASARVVPLGISDHCAVVVDVDV